MPLSAEQVYNDLNGEEVKEILLIRFADLLNAQPEFKRHITLTRVRMMLTVTLDIAGRTPPTLSLDDDLVVRMRDESPVAGADDYEDTRQLEAAINADTTTTDGQPPDLVREEHGIPVMEPKRTPMGHQDVPVTRGEPKYAFHVTQDYGPARTRTGAEGPIIGGEAITTKNAGGRPDVNVDFGKVRDPNYLDKKKAGDA